MKVLHVIAGLNTGGAENLLLRTVQAMPAWEHHVINLQTGGGLVTALEQAGACVYHAHMPPSRGSLRGLMRLLRLTRRIRPALMQGWMYHGNVAAWCARPAAGAQAKLVQSIHNLTPVATDYRPATRLVAALNGCLSGMADQVVYVAQSSLRAHVACGFDAGNARYIPAGVTLPQPVAQARQALRAELHVPQDTPLVGIVARLHPMKDHENFLRAAALLPAGVHFVVAGTGLHQPQKAWHALIPATLAPRLHWLGPRQDVAALLQGLDLCTLASRSEALPLILLEALAGGTLCAATDVGDCLALLQDIGFVAAAENPRALAEAWCQALRLSPGQRILRTHLGQERVRQHFSLQHWCQALDNVYREVLA